MNKRGIVFSLDAIFAVLIASAIVLASFYFFAQSDRQDHLTNNFLVAQDIAIVLDKSGSLQNAVTSGDTSNLRQFLNTLPSQICANLTLHTASLARVTSVQREDCTPTNRTAQTRRTFFPDDQTHFVEVSTWQR